MIPSILTYRKRYTPFRHLGSVLRKKKPIHLTVFLTRRCNAACRFCFYLSGSAPAGPDCRELSLPELKKISKSMGKLLWLAFSGGEIYLRHDLVEITNQFYQVNQPAIILLPTNGLLPKKIREMTESILRQCPKSTVVVKISLDGPASTHDDLRGVSGAFQKALTTYEALRPLLKQFNNFELGINSVLCGANQDEMENTISWVGDLKDLRTHTVSLIRGNVADESLKDVDPQRYACIAGLLEKRLRKKKDCWYQFAGARLKTAQDILQRRYIHRTMIKKKSLLPCYAGRLSLVITENGDLYPCESFSMKIGNLRENKFELKALLASREAGIILNNIRNRECYCTHECSFLLNILFNPAMVPALLRELFHLYRSRRGRSVEKISGQP